MSTFLEQILSLNGVLIAQLMIYRLWQLTGQSVVEHVCVHAEGLCTGSVLGRDRQTCTYFRCINMSISL